MSDNPYSSPQAEINSPPVSRGMQKATQGKRFWGYIIDQIALTVIGMGAGAVIGVLFAMSAGGQLTPEAGLTLQLVSTFAGYFCALCYYVVLEAATGQTFGKMAMGTTVVNETGGKPSFGQIIGRTLCRFIPFEPLSFFFGGDTKHPTGWHDTIPKTLVVMK